MLNNFNSTKIRFSFTKIKMHSHQNFLSHQIISKAEIIPPF